jgi:hypothetical protein
MVRSMLDIAGLVDIVVNTPNKLGSSSISPIASIRWRV